MWLYSTQDPGDRDEDKVNSIPGADAEQLRAVVREFLGKRSDDKAVR